VKADTLESAGEACDAQAGAEAMLAGLLVGRRHAF